MLPPDIGFERPDFSLGSSSRVYDILGRGGCCAHPKLPGPTPALLYRTCTPQKRGPKSADLLPHTHNTANAEAPAEPRWALPGPPTVVE